MLNSFIVSKQESPLSNHVSFVQLQLVWRLYWVW